MQRVFTEQMGNFRRGDAPERPVWWWEPYKNISLPLPTVIEAGLAALKKPQRAVRKTG